LQKANSKLAEQVNMQTDSREKKSWAESFFNKEHS